MSTPVPSHAPAVRLRNLSVIFGGEPALSEIDLTIESGTSVALVGANGSGKTTLLNVLAGLVKPNSGDLQINSPGRPAYVLQHQQADRWLPLTVDEVLKMGLYAKAGLLGRLSSSQLSAKNSAAEELDVAHLLQRQFGDLSGGQRQRVLVAQALAQQTDLVLLDEPITGLDLPSQTRILALIDSCAEMDRTIVLSTHNLDEARHCDLVVLIATRVVAAGPPVETLTAHNLRMAFGDKVLGDHSGHAHSNELLMIDDHGHHH